MQMRFYIPHVLMPLQLTGEIIVGNHGYVLEKQLNFNKVSNKKLVWDAAPRCR